MNREKLRGRIRAALGDTTPRRILVITGAGVSADSNIPTYRGVGGIYDGIETADGVTIEEALSGQMFERDPTTCWKYIRQIEEACRGASPNAGHTAIAQLDNGSDTWVLTQNVDGLHHRAGSRQVIDIHGDVHMIFCPKCKASRRVADYATLARPPKCVDCETVERPDVVLFGEMLPPHKLSLLRDQRRLGFDLVLSVGTTSMFPYISSPVIEQVRSGGVAIEVNPGETPLSDIVTEKIAERAAVAMPLIVDVILEST